MVYILSIFNHKSILCSNSWSEHRTMTSIMKVEVCLAVIIFCLFHSAVTNELVITCQAPTVVTGQTARVTCDYNVSVSDIKPAYYSVDFYASGSSSPEEIATCTIVDSDQLGCSVKRRGDVFKTTDKPTELVLEMPKAATSHEGRYVCKLAAELVNTRPEPCTLMVEENAFPIQPGGTGVTSSPGVTRSPAEESDKSSFWIIVGASVGGGVLLIVVVVVVVVLLLRRKCNQQSLDVEKNKNQSKEAAPLNPPGSPKQDPLVQPPNETLRGVREEEEEGDTTADDPFIHADDDDDDINDEEGTKEKYKVRRRSSALSEEVEVVAAVKQIGVKQKMRNKEFPWDGSVEDLRLKNNY